ncbi:MAG: hypothetical protein BroJett024_30120 [Alphaproteobacteria bacterium]|mgnify:CR=1 FL=1|nr:MAG: hypothetical protein BroJett024_30120 [Alphaproteobacteria bacterium]
MSLIAFAPRRLCASLAAAALLLAGCTLPDDKALTMVNRGKYSLFNCDQLKSQAVQARTRERELREAMAKAAAGPGGELVNAVAYRSEYLTVKGEIEELEITANAKNCRQSVRAISDGVIR